LRQPLERHIAFMRSANVAIISWEKNDRSSISNALMIAPPNNEFIAEWLRRIPQALQSPTWAHGGVVLPGQLAEEDSLRNSRLIVNNNFACPLDLSRPWLFDPALREEATKIASGATAIHVFETYWRDIVKDIDHDWIDKTPCLFSDIFNVASRGRHP
jgi:hypothetical protein